MTYQNLSQKYGANQHTFVIVLTSDQFLVELCPYSHVVFLQHFPSREGQLQVARQTQDLLAQTTKIVSVRTTESLHTWIST
jgi:hypothetical protein